MEFRVGPRLRPRILLLDGLSGSGKSVFSSVFSQLLDYNPPRFHFGLEWFLIGSSKEGVDDAFAPAWLELLVDQLTYDWSIAREVNLRPGDSTSILKLSSGRHILNLLKPGGPGALNAKNTRGLQLITHQIFPSYPILSRVFEDRLFFVEIVRKPLSIYPHWVAYVSRHGKDPLDFTLLHGDEAAEAPWFFGGSLARYKESNNETKAALLLTSLYRQLFDFVDSYGAKREVLVVPFERFVLQPDAFLSEIEKMSGSEFSKNLGRVLRSQRVPRKGRDFKPKSAADRRHATNQTAEQLLRNVPKDLGGPLKQMDLEYDKRFMQIG